MGAKLGSSGGPMAEINVTPLIDVVLVLLIIMMVITPLLQSGLPVDLPVATQVTTVNDVGQHVVLSVTYEGEDVPPRWAVEQETATPETLLDLINAEYAKNPQRSILIKGDHRVQYQQVREMMDILSDKNITTIFIAAGKED